MFKRTRFTTPLAAAGLLALALPFATPALASDISSVLDPDNVRRDAYDPEIRRAAERLVASLPPEARAAFLEAAQHRDRINDEAAIEALDRAATYAPENIDMQFLLVRWAQRKAEMNYGEESLRAYEMAESALRRLLANTLLNPEQRDRALRESESIREAREGLRARDDARMTAGFNLVSVIHEQRLEKNGMSDFGAKNLAQRAIDQRNEAQQAALKNPWIESEAPGASLFEAARSIITGTSPVNQMQGFGPMGQPAPPMGFSSSGPMPGGPFAGGAPPAQDPFAPSTTGDPFAAADPFATADPFGATAVPNPDPFGQQQQPAAAPSDWDPMRDF